MKLSWLLAYPAVAAELARPEEPPDALFSHDSDVLEINKPTDLLNHILNDPKGECGNADLVLFYSAWCPHCKNFAPRWHDLAAFINKCTGGKSEPHFKISAFECALTNPERISSVQDFATLNRTGPEFADGTPRTMCHNFVPASFPTIGIFTKSDCNLTAPAMPGDPGKLKHLFDPVKDNVKYYYLDMATSRLWIGSILNALSQSGTLTVCEKMKKMICETSDNDQELIGALKRIKLLPAGNPAAPEYSGGQWSSTAAVEVSLPRWIPQQESQRSDSRFHDAILGAYAIINEWILPDGPLLTGSNLNAARNFLKILASTWAPQPPLIKLLQKIEKEDSVETEYLRDVLAGSQPLTIRGVPTNDTATTCYTRTCLIWTFFHSLTVEGYEAARNRADITIIRPDESARILPSIDVMMSTRGIVDPEFIPEILHQLVQAFFACETCQQHYQVSFNLGLADRRTWTSTTKYPMDLTKSIGSSTGTQAASTGLLLWLWRFHNLVNVRTAMEKAVEDLRRQIVEGIPANEQKLLFNGQDVRFPSQNLCSNCRKAGNTTVLFEMTPDVVREYVESNGDESKVKFDYYEDFDLDNVRDFLVKVYHSSPAGAMYSTKDKVFKN